MGTHTRPSDTGSELARRLLNDVGRELRAARVDRDLSLRAVSRAAGVSIATLSRLERGLVPGASVLDLARVHAAVGLALSLKSFPGGQPIRDGPQVALLEAFRSRLHSSLRWRTEVPLPIPGDRRAWDATIRGADFLVGVECETAPRDVQATLRRIALKTRDGRVDAAILLLADTVQARAFLEAAGEMLRADFPVDGNRALALLSGGLDPGGSAVIMLKRRHRASRFAPAVTTEAPVRRRDARGRNPLRAG